MGKIFYLMGKSSSGKDTIYKKLMQDESLGLKTIVGYTTRPLREGEEDGMEYFFVDEAEFEKLKGEGKIIESRSYNTAHGIWTYFTVDDGQIDIKRDILYLMIGTLESYEKVRNYFGQDSLVPLYLSVDDGERLSRALLRERKQKQPKYSEMCRRFLADEADFSKENLEKCGIDKFYENDNIEVCIEKIKKVIIERWR